MAEQIQIPFEMIHIHTVYGKVHRTQKLVKIKSGGVGFVFYDEDSKQEETVRWNDISYISND